MVSETMALNATVEPMFMRPMIADTMAQKAMERRGSAVRASTCDRKSENGSPLSRANAQVWRDAAARKPKDAQTTSAMRMAVSTEEPAWEESVAVKKTWMKSKPVGLVRSVDKSPRVKQKAMLMARPRVPFSRMVEIMAQGTTVEALRTSSARWQGPSKPMKPRFELMRPTNQARPLLFQPATSVNSVKTNEGDPFGARMTKGIMMAKKPAMCKTSAKVSMCGNMRPRSVLTIAQHSKAAKRMSVPCQRS